MAEKEKAELIKRIYELGYEVGLKKHSEVGWVLREYNSLLERAQKLGIRSPESYYEDGKLQGKDNRDKGFEASSKMPEKTVDVEKKVKLEEPSGLREDFQDTIVQKPSFNELPKFIKKSSTTEMPEFLHGFKPYRRR